MSDKLLRVESLLFHYPSTNNSHHPPLNLNPDKWSHNKSRFDTIIWNIALHDVPLDPSSRITGRRYIRERRKGGYCAAEAVRDGQFTLRSHQEYGWRADDENFNSFDRDLVGWCDAFMYYYRILEEDSGLRRNDKGEEFRFQPTYLPPPPLGTGWPGL